MPDEKPDKPRATRTYKVLRPEPPAAGEPPFAKYIGLGEYVADSPETAVEKAADEFSQLEGGRFVAVALTGWQERDAIAEVVRAWNITRPGVVEEIDPEDAAAVGEPDAPEEPTQELDTVEEPTIEQPTDEAPTGDLSAVSDEDAMATEQAALEAAEAEGA